MTPHQPRRFSARATPNVPVFRINDAIGYQSIVGFGASYRRGRRVNFEASRRVHFLILSGAGIREPVVFDGHFMMNERSQIEAAAARYRAGGMGHLLEGDRIMSE